jgi:hypothetical protein
MTGALETQPARHAGIKNYWARVAEWREAALAYARAGIPVFPCAYPVELAGGTIRCCVCPLKQKCDSPGKHPRYMGGFRDAAKDPKVIETWWGAGGARHNIGIRTGADSGLVVLDVDPSNGGDEALVALERRYGALPPTWRFLTGGGGQHISFAPPGGYVNSRANALGPGLDIKADAGFIIAPPSEHISGQHYAFSDDHRPEELPLAAVPEWMISQLSAKSAQSDREKGRRDWEAFAKEAVLEGQRNEKLASLAGLLFKKLPYPELVAELIVAWNASRCKPPLAESEVWKIVDSIALREADRIRRASNV